MARYIAQVLIVVDADSASEAADAMSGALSETLKYRDEAIVEWSYCRDGDNYQFPRPIPESADTDLEDEDLSGLYASAAPCVEV